MRKKLESDERANRLVSLQGVAGRMTGAGDPTQSFFVLVAKILPIMYSVRIVETYQVAASYPLLPPSTIVGAIAKSLSMLGYCGTRSSDWKSKVNDCLNYTRGLVFKARDTSILAEGRGPGKQTSIPISVRQPVILHVLRKVLEENRLPSSLKEIEKFSDAMVREYMISPLPRLLLIISKGPKDRDTIRKLKEAILLISRLGNSESLVSVLGVSEPLEAKPCQEKNVNIVIKYSPDLVKGSNYTVVKAIDEEGRESAFAMPVTSGGRGDVYYSSSIEVERDTLCVVYDNAKIVFPAGDEW
jgi:CRISPR-associated protein Cas5a/b/c